MLDAALTLSAVIVFVLPGFVLVEAARARRGATADGGEWPLILRALSYSVAIHIIFSMWTASVARDVPAWKNHTSELALYGFVVVLVAPIAAGYGLGKLLDRTEVAYSNSRPPWWYYAVGARDARDAWDFAFQNTDGCYVIVRTDKGLIAGKYSQASYAGQTPHPHDLFLEEVWTLKQDASGLDQFDAPMVPPYSVWLSQDTIRDIFFAREPTA